MTQNWPADRVERRAIETLVPSAKNARTHSEEQVLQLAASMKEWGWTNPVLVDDAGAIIAGHGRVLAGRKLGLAEVPVMVAEGWTEAQKRAYMIADNQLTLNAGWDMGLLRGELRGLKEWEFDVALLGFSDLDALLADVGHPGLTDPDAVPDTPEAPKSTRGDLWRLGRHFLLCGDSTSAEDTQKVLGEVKPHLMVTDPPYGVDYDPEWRNNVIMVKGEKPGEHGGRSLGRVSNDHRADWSAAWALFPGAVAYIWHGERQLLGMGQELTGAGFELRNLIVWGKSQLVIGRGHYHSQHETCWYAVRKSKTGNWTGDRKQTTLWQIEKPKKSETGHGTQKPVECMKRPIENNSSPGQAVYDPFVGSGTTIIAAEMTGRACHAIELNPAYVDVAVTRWQDFTGQKATLEGDGRTFEEATAERELKVA